MLGAILKQLVSRGGIQEHIREAFQKAKGEFGGRGLRIPDMVEFLKRLSHHYHGYLYVLTPWTNARRSTDGASFSHYEK